jgi:septal ring factor EnvC (AmiA/AmiB activator)
MARIDAAVGDKVMAGEPVGIMGDAATPGPTLYLELRRKGRPVDPLPWLAAGRTEVNG